MRPFHEEIPRRVRRGYRGDPLRKYVRLFEVVSDTVGRFEYVDGCILKKLLFTINYYQLFIIIKDAAVLGAIYGLVAYIL